MLLFALGLLTGSLATLAIFLAYGRSLIQKRSADQAFVLEYSFDLDPFAEVDHASARPVIVPVHVRDDRPFTPRLVHPFDTE